MKLIIDAGSTQSTWVLIDGLSIVDTQTLKGINPTQNPQSLDNITPYKSPNSVAPESVYYYGSGVITPTQKQNIISALTSKTNAQTASVETDITGACRAISDEEQSIVTILGTGVNTVLYDGKKVIKKAVSLGALLDEPGSGFSIGKKIIQAYYRNQMSIDDKQVFENLIGDKNLIHTIYSDPRPNYYVASFCKKLNNFSAGFRQEILEQNFSEFFENQISVIPSSAQYKLNFVGSIAHVFRAELKEVALSYGYTIDKIEKSPIEGLIKYHSRE